jgi:hypothetical protein
MLGKYEVKFLLVNSKLIAFPSLLLSSGYINWENKSPSIAAEVQLLAHV